MISTRSRVTAFGLIDHNGHIEVHRKPFPLYGGCIKMRAALPIQSFGTGIQVHAGSWFSRMANATAAWTGKPVAFLLAFATIVIWAVTGPLFHYSDTWQLVINTGTTIITFLMVFLIQNTQNRDTLALQVKLSELILALNEADNRIAAIEESSDEELQTTHEEIKERALCQS
jgi:low affinity Fe/Cu permease